jgi:predicted metalloprotease with PDZ domain
MPETSPPVTYIVDLSGREQHLVTVRMHLPADATADGGRLTAATWTPGSYVVRDYVHHLQRIAATDATGAPVPLTSVGLSAWTFPPGRARVVRLRIVGPHEPCRRSSCTARRCGDLPAPRRDAGA